MLDTFSEMLPDYLEFDPHIDKCEEDSIEKRNKESTDYIVAKFKADKVPDIVVLGEVQELKEQSELCNSIVGLVKDLDRRLGYHVMLNLDNYQKGTGRDLSTIQAFVEKHNLHRPKFTLMNYEESLLFCEDNDIVESDPGSLVLTFQLPKPLAAYWEKGKGDWGEAGIEIDNSVIPWGTIYRNVLPIVWEELRDLENSTLINFQRSYSIGTHDKFKYYYVWEISNRVSTAQVVQENDEALQQVEDEHFRKVSGESMKDPLGQYTRRGGRQDHGTKVTPTASKTADFLSTTNYDSRRKQEIKDKSNILRRREDKLSSLQGLNDFNDDDERF